MAQLIIEPVSPSSMAAYAVSDADTFYEALASINDDSAATTENDGTSSDIRFEPFPAPTRDDGIGIRLRYFITELFTPDRRSRRAGPRASARWRTV